MIEKSAEVLRLTAHQKMILGKLADGAMLTLDRHNMLCVDGVYLQPVTRTFLTRNRLVTKADRSRAAATAGNGFVITEKGLAALKL